MFSKRNFLKSKNIPINIVLILKDKFIRKDKACMCVPEQTIRTNIIHINIIIQSLGKLIMD